MPASEYVALHEVRLDLGDRTLEFAPGKAYTGPDENVPGLLKGNRRCGPLIAKRDSDEGKAAISRARSDKTDTADTADASSSGGATTTARTAGKES